MLGCRSHSVLAHPRYLARAKHTLNSRIIAIMGVFFKLFNSILFLGIEYISIIYTIYKKRRKDPTHICTLDF